MMEPLVSVIMPSYNGGKYIREAIESILYQTYKNFELIIIEDHSTDNSEKIIKDYTDPRVRLFINENNMGIAYSTNKGIKNARGKYIALLDDDDIATEDRIELQVNHLESHKCIDVLGGGSVVIDENGQYIASWNKPRHNPKFIKAKLLFENVGFGNGSVMFRKEFVENHQLLYKDGCMGMQDFRFFIDASKVGNISSIDKTILKIREHNERETRKKMLFFGKERAELYAAFQRYSLCSSGFNLEEREFSTINHILQEGEINGDSWQEWYNLYSVFKKILYLAKEKKIDYYSELECMCRKKLQGLYAKIDVFNSVSGQIRIE